MNSTAQQIKIHLQQELSKVMVGTEAHLDMLAIGIISGGNLLISGAPGTGKTLLSKSLMQLLGQEAARIDCGNDIEFTNILHAVTGGIPNPGVHKNNSLFYLVGLNRLTPNTQAILLPVMEEHQLLNHGEVIKLHHDLRLIATFDPGCFDDTYPLLEALLDRFYFCLPMPYPTPEQQRELLKSHAYPLAASELVDTPDLTPLAAEQIIQAREQANAVVVTDAIYDYVIQIVQSLRHHQNIQHGASQRGSLSMINAAKIHATLMEQDYVNPDDIQAVVDACLSHRLQLNSDALINGAQISEIIAGVVQQTELPQNAPDQN